MGFGQKKEGPYSIPYLLPKVFFILFLIDYPDLTVKIASSGGPVILWLILTHSHSLLPSLFLALLQRYCKHLEQPLNFLVYWPCQSAITQLSTNRSRYSRNGWQLSPEYAWWKEISKERHTGKEERSMMKKPPLYKPAPENIFYGSTPKISKGMGGLFLPCRITL